MSQSSKRQEFKVAGLAAALSHYTDAVRFEDTLFVSGLTAHDANGKLVGGNDTAAQTRQILSNLKLVLDAAGATFDVKPSIASLKDGRVLRVLAEVVEDRLAEGDAAGPDGLGRMAPGSPAPVRA